jgi:ActR/RegA family two-component response regulator
MKMATGFTAVGLGSRTSLSKPVQKDKLNNILNHNIIVG